MSDPTIKDFEAAIAELETIVKKLEEGDLALEKSLELYERGVQLSRFCHSRLEEAERRIEIVNERGELKPAPACAQAARRRSRNRDVRGVSRGAAQGSGAALQTWLPTARPKAAGGGLRGDALQPVRAAASGCGRCW